MEVILWYSVSDEVVYRINDAIYIYNVMFIFHKKFRCYNPVLINTIRFPVSFANSSLYLI